MESIKKEPSELGSENYDDAEETPDTQPTTSPPATAEMADRNNTGQIPSDH